MHVWIHICLCMWMCFPYTCTYGMKVCKSTHSTVIWHSTFLRKQQNKMRGLYSCLSAARDLYRAPNAPESNLRKRKMSWHSCIGSLVSRCLVSPVCKSSVWCVRHKEQKSSRDALNGSFVYITGSASCNISPWKPEETRHQWATLHPFGFFHNATSQEEASLLIASFRDKKKKKSSC